MTRDELDALAAGWPECDYWYFGLCPDELQHASIVEALSLPTFGNELQLRQWGDQVLSPVARRGRTAYGWTRKKVSQADIDSMVEHLTDAFHEHWCEVLELGNPEDGDERVKNPEWLRAAITNDMRTRHVWQCEQTHQVELTFEQILGIGRLLRPELFGVGK
jgi:hypothetical protein